MASPKQEEGLNGESDAAGAQEEVDFSLPEVCMHVVALTAAWIE